MSELDVRSFAQRIQQLDEENAALRAEIQAARLSESINVNERNDIIQRMRAENERLKQTLNAEQDAHIEESTEERMLRDAWKREVADLRAQVTALEQERDTLNKDCGDLRALAERLLARLSEGKVMIDDIRITTEDI